MAVKVVRVPSILVAGSRGPAITGILGALPAAPAASRIAVKLAASIAPVRRAPRHNSELAANAIIVAAVSAIVPSRRSTLAAPAPRARRADHGRWYTTASTAPSASTENTRRASAGIRHGRVAGA